MRVVVLLTLLAGSAVAAPGDWSPGVYVGEDTLDFRTTAPGEEPHWSRVWLVVLDDNQVYIRLGSRAAARITSNTTKPFVAVRIAGREFERVRADAAPDMAGRVATAMAGKYLFDIIIRHVDHPLTLRLVPTSPRVSKPL